MAYSFDRSNKNLVAGTSRTLVYGPVPSGYTAIVFSGTLANIDSSGSIQHSITLESHDGSAYTKHLYQIPVQFGASSKVPKVVLKSGDSLYATADQAGSIECNVNVVLIG